MKDMGSDWVAAVHRNHVKLGYHSGNCVLCDLEARDDRRMRWLACAILVASGALMAFALWFVVILLSWILG